MALDLNNSIYLAATTRGGAAGFRPATDVLMYNDMQSNAQNGFGPMGYWGSWNNNNPGLPDWDPH